MKSRSFAGFLALVLTACGAGEDWHGIGYRDGYAVGYNTACQIRATPIHGEFDRGEYARGYSEGMTAGVADCNASKAISDESE